MDDERVFPEGFLDAYRSVFWSEPPEAFLEAYDVLKDILYFGTGLPPEGGGGIRGKRFHEGYWFGAAELLGFAGAVDRRVAALRGEIRRYQRAHRREVQRGQAPSRARRRDLGSVGGDGPGGAQQR